MGKICRFKTNLMKNEDHIDYAEVVTRIVYCADWKEKEQILRKAIRRLMDIERLEQINNQLLNNEREYEVDET